MIVVGISGASGPILGIRLIEELLNLKERVYAILSGSARSIITHELGYPMDKASSFTDLIKTRTLAKNSSLLSVVDDTNFFSPPASGSSRFEAVVVMPCSMKTLSSVANGYADSLITRACDVALKEKRRLLLVPRETPLNLIHIENMKKAAIAGADIVPPVLGFYTHPKTIDDMINFTVGKVLNLLGKHHSLFQSWEEMSHNFIGE
ncbi:MAG: UbiX family flavin prenyltransferase [Proteobacteria bacterium]|nr:UbiX family flavin prenyltransferase [Pseudomonadota bacterium]